jgi:uncharacterized membrane protein YbhN (UPF0104 family)
MSARRTALLLLNVVIVAAFAIAVQRAWGWQRLFAPWREVPPSWLGLAALAQLLSYGLRALRIYVAETQIPRGRYAGCLRLVLINNALNLLLPMRSGEASFPLLMNRWFGVSLVHATGTLIWLRLLDLHVLATVGLLCIATGWIGRAGGLSTGLALGALLAVTAPTLLFLLRRPLSAWCRKREGRLAALAHKLLAGVPVRWRGLGFDLGLTWAAWGTKLAALGWLLSQLASLPLPAGVLGAIGGDLSTVLPIHTPGGFGTYEAGALAALATALSPGPALLAAVVNLHLFVLTAALLAGAAGWLCGTPRAAVRA